MVKPIKAPPEHARPAWAECPAFHNVWCHAPWTCTQPCLGLASITKQEPTQ